MTSEQEPISISPDPEVVPTPNRHVVRKAGIGATAIAAAATAMGGLTAPSFAAEAEQPAGIEATTNEDTLCNVLEILAKAANRPELASIPRVGIGYAGEAQAVGGETQIVQEEKHWAVVPFTLDNGDRVNLVIDILPCAPITRNDTEKPIKPTDQELDEQFSINALKKRGYKPTSKKDFMDVVRKNAPILQRYGAQMHYDYMDEESEVIEEFGQYVIDKITRGNLGVKDLGYFLSTGISSGVRHAKSVAKSDPELANAYMEIAQAKQGLGQKYVIFEKNGKRVKDPQQIDKMMDRMIQDAWDNDY